MYRYTIDYQYGTYSGTQRIWADDEEQAILALWRSLRPYMALSMAYTSARVVKVETEGEAV